MLTEKAATHDENPVETLCIFTAKKDTMRAIAVTGLRV